jgi:uncharacterized protein
MNAPCFAKILFLATFLSFASAAETLPPAPTRYFDDRAALVAEADAVKINARLAQFERDTSVQFVITVFPKLETEAKFEDYCTHLFNSWHVGQKGKNNGVVLFLFMAEHRSRLELGRGMEKVISNERAAEILKDVLAPHFKRKEFAAGLEACVDAVIKETGTAFSGSGATVSEKGQAGGKGTEGSEPEKK